MASVTHVPFHLYWLPCAGLASYLNWRPGTHLSALALIFWFVINAMMIELVSALMASSGFYVAGFGPAFIGAIVLCIVNMLLKSLLLSRVA